MSASSPPVYYLSTGVPKARQTELEEGQFEGSPTEAEMIAESQIVIDSILALFLMSAVAGGTGGTQESYQRELSNIIYTRLGKRKITEEAKVALDTFIKDGARQLVLDHASADQLKRAENSAEVLADTISKLNGKSLEIVAATVKSAKISLCPLYPFCRAKVEKT